MMQQLLWILFSLYPQSEMGLTPKSNVYTVDLIQNTFQMKVQVSFGVFHFFFITVPSSLKLVMLFGITDTVFGNWKTLCNIKFIFKSKYLVFYHT